MKQLAASMLATALAWSLGFVQEPDPAPLFEGATECTDCAGAGTVQDACARCSGSTVHPCPRCVPDMVDRPRDLRIGLLTWVSVLNDMPDRGLLARRDQILDAGKRLTAGISTANDASGGHVTCPKGCRDGRSGDKRCSTCKGEGVVECPACDGEASLPCEACEDGQTDRPCRPCSGHGQVVALDRLSEDTVERCAFCGILPPRPCGTCEGGGSLKASCGACLGARKLTCTTCTGSASLVCMSCLGSGRANLADPSSRKCKNCKGKGRVTCDDCKRGESKCDACVGGVSKKTPCPDCLWDVGPWCPGCELDPTLAWRHTADRLLAAGREILACAYLEQAMKREESLRQLLDEELGRREQRGTRVGATPGSWNPLTELKSASEKRSADVQARLEELGS